jgi:hypothetical protein
LWGGLRLLHKDIDKGLGLRGWRDDGDIWDLWGWGCGGLDEDDFVVLLGWWGWDVGFTGFGVARLWWSGEKSRIWVL